jgi:hypothetical protein
MPTDFLLKIRQGFCLLCIICCFFLDLFPRFSHVRFWGSPLFWTCALLRLKSVFLIAHEVHPPPAIIFLRLSEHATASAQRPPFPFMIVIAPCLFIEGGALAPPLFQTWLESPFIIQKVIN